MDFQCNLNIGNQSRTLLFREIYPQEINMAAYIIEGMGRPAAMAIDPATGSFKFVGPVPQAFTGLETTLSDELVGKHV